MRCSARVHASPLLPRDGGMQDSSYDIFGNNNIYCKYVRSYVKICTYEYVGTDVARTVTR